MRPTYWQNYPSPFYKDYHQEPIPGWGVRPVMAGPEMVGVGALPWPEQVPWWYAPTALVVGYVLGVALTRKYYAR